MDLRFSNNFLTNKKLGVFTINFKDDELAKATGLDPTSVEYAFKKIEQYFGQSMQYILRAQSETAIVDLVNHSTKQYQLF